MSAAPAMPSSNTWPGPAPAALKPGEAADITAALKEIDTVLQVIFRG